MSADVGLALKVAECFTLIGKIRIEGVKALEVDHEPGAKAPEATVRLMAAHAHHLQGVGGNLIVPTNLTRHLGFGQYCDIQGIVSFDLVEIEAGIKGRLLSVGKEAVIPVSIGFEDILLPEIANAALPLYRLGDYRGAVIRGCEVLITVVRERTGLTFDGVALVNQAFKAEGGLLCIDGGAGETARNRRVGLADLMRGAMAAIRNVYVHEPNIKPSPEAAARHLALLSTLVQQALRAKRA